MEQSKIIEFANAYTDALRKRDSLAALRRLEETFTNPDRYGYLDDNNHVVRCRMSDLFERYSGRDPYRPGWMARKVGSDVVRRRYWVSTVFLGLDHAWGGRSQWFETMVFPRDSMCDLHMQRYETYDEAIIGHERALADGLNRQGWARWLGYSASHLRKIRREQRARDHLARC